jgi:putative phage-type endonuclease
MTNTDKLHYERRTGLGGSDALAYCGKDPRCTPLDLYREKLGEAPPREDTERTAWGRRLEPVVLDWLADELGRRIDTSPDYTFRSSVHPMLIGHLDGVTAEPREGVEIKTADKFMAAEFGEAGTDLVPVRYVLQCMHYMLVTGLRRFHLAALIGGNEGRHYVIDWDQELADMLIERAEMFWAHVEGRIPPDPQTLTDADYRWPTSVEKFLKAPETILASVGNLRDLRRVEHEAASKADAIELSLKAFMGEHALLTDDTGHKLATWRQQSRERFDAKRFTLDHPDLAAQYRTSSTFRVFLLK